MKKSKRFLVTVAALSVMFFIPIYANVYANGEDYNQQHILNELEALKQKVKSQQEYIDRLTIQMNESMDKKIEKVEEKIAADQGSKVKLPDYIDQLEIKGDLRVRYERRDRSGEDGGRDRLRTRLRVGGVWQNKAEDWEIGVGVATGGEDGTSTNDTWGEDYPFETGDLRLDYAYAKHTINEFSFTLGQHKNPFVTSWLLWDSDLRPAGLTAQYANDFGFFATLGGYGVLFYNNDTAMMYAGQVGYENTINDIKFTVAAGYQHYDSIFSDDVAPNPDYDFQIGDLYAEVEFNAGPVKLSPYAQVWKNFGADGNVSQLHGFGLDPEDEDMGWVAGLDAKIGQVKLGYAYAVVGADSVYYGLKDSDFGSGLGDGIDVKGHKISASYAVTKHMSAGITAMLYEYDECDNDRDANLYMFDVVYKF